MTRAILEFNFPEDTIDFTRATEGANYFDCLWDVSQELRRIRKYESLSEEQAELIERVEKFFWDVVGDLLEEVYNG